MKKAFKITGIVLIVFFAILLVLPFVFKGKLMEIAKSEGNKMLQAKFDFTSLDLSFIRNFPKATVTLNNLYIAGVGEFENDTLLSVSELKVAVNVMSVIGDDGIEISKIILKDPAIHAIVLADGKANWDIMKETDEVETDTKEESGTMKLSLKELVISGARIHYDERQAGMDALINNLNLTLSGDFSADKTTMQTKAKIDDLTYTMGNITYLKNAKIGADITAEADLKNNLFTLKDNTFSLNAIETSLNGWLKILPNGYDMDMTMNTSKVQFKDILSLIPAIYSKDFETIKTEGTIAMKATAKGVMQGDTLPAFDVNIAIGNAMFQYPSLPQSVKDIQVDASFKNPGGSADLTTIDINKFHFNMAGNPIDFKLHLSTPVSDPNIQASAQGKLDLKAVKEVYPLEGMELQGKLDANLQLAGRYSYVEQQKYDQFKAEGSLGVQELTFKGDSIPEVTIEKMLMTFSPQYIHLSETKLMVGKNDFTVSGDLENMLAYALKDEVLKGKLAVASNYLNLNDFMSNEEESSKDTVVLTAPEVPKNIDFNMNATFGKILFEKLEMTNSKGGILVKDGKVTLDNLSTNALGGSMLVNGYYSTAANPTQPELNFKVDLKNVSFIKTFQTFDLIQKLAPIFENMSGNFSTKLDLTTQLKNDYMPLLESLKAAGNLSSQEMKVSGLKVMDMLAEKLGNDKLKSISSKDINIPFTIQDGRVTTDAFNLQSGDIKMNLSGSTGLDQTIDYAAKVTLPAKANLGGVLSTANVKIGGTFTKPQISLGVKDMAKEALDVVKGKAEQKLLKALGGKDSTASAAIDRGKAKLIEEATSAAAKLTEEADAAGQKLISEADAAGKKLIEKAGNPIAKATAKVAAKKLKDEAESKAKKLKEEAQKKGQKLIEEATAKEAPLNNQGAK